MWEKGKFVHCWRKFSLGSQILRGQEFLVSSCQEEALSFRLWVFLLSSCFHFSPLSLCYENNHNNNSSDHNNNLCLTVCFELVFTCSLYLWILNLIPSMGGRYNDCPQFTDKQAEAERRNNFLHVRCNQQWAGLWSHIAQLCCVSSQRSTYWSWKPSTSLILPLPCHLPLFLDEVLGATLSEAEGLECSTISPLCFPGSQPPHAPIPSNRLMKISPDEELNTREQR